MNSPSRLEKWMFLFFEKLDDQMIGQDEVVDQQIDDQGL